MPRKPLDTLEASNTRGSGRGRVIIPDRCLTASAGFGAEPQRVDRRLATWTLWERVRKARHSPTPLPPPFSRGGRREVRESLTRLSRYEKQCCGPDCLKRGKEGAAPPPGEQESRHALPTDESLCSDFAVFCAILNAIGRMLITRRRAGLRERPQGRRSAGSRPPCKRLAGVRQHTWLASPAQGD